MEVIIEVEVLCFSTFPQLFFLKKEKPCLKGCLYKKRNRKATQSSSGMQLSQKVPSTASSTLRMRIKTQIAPSTKTLKASCCYWNKSQLLLLASRETLCCVPGLCLLPSPQPDPSPGAAQTPGQLADLLNSFCAANAEHL